jgi:hypothetical protein
VPRCEVGNLLQRGPEHVVLGLELAELVLQVLVVDGEIGGLFPEELVDRLEVVADKPCTTFMPAALFPFTSCDRCPARSPSRARGA